MSGETKIADLSLSKFQELENSIKPYAEAEQNPLLCALLLAKIIEKADKKATALAGIASKYA